MKQQTELREEGKRKALIVTANSGFLPQFELDHVRILKSRGFEVHYISNFEKPFYEFDRSLLDREQIICHHMDCEKSPLALKANRKAYRQLTELIRKENFDLFHVHNPMAGVLGRLAARASRPVRNGRAAKPFVIYTAHGFHFYKGCSLSGRLLYKNAEFFMARFTDMIITINGEDFENAGKMRLRNGGTAERVYGVGADEKVFTGERRDRERMRKELEIPENAFHLVTAAELTGNKNQETVIRALSMLDQPDIFYSLCGKGEDEGILRELIKSEGLEGRVRLLGYRTDMPQVLQSADCFVLPSRREGLPISVVEALLSGLPVIAADNRGTRELIQDEKNGIICYNNSTDEYRAAVRKLYEDRELLRKLSSCARASAEKFTCTYNRKVMEQIYDKAIAKMEEQ